MDPISPRGYALFTTEPDEIEKMTCQVCGTLCNVERSIHAPTGWAEAMGRRGHWHDKFTCPHIDEAWHEQALELLVNIEDSPSKRLAALMRLDLEEILREHGCLRE